MPRPSAFPPAFDRAAAEDRAARPAVIWLRVLALWGAGLAAGAQFAKFAVPMAELEMLYPGRGAGLGFLLSVVSLVGLALGLVTGEIAARVGDRRRRPQLNSSMLAVPPKTAR